MEPVVFFSQCILRLRRRLVSRLLGTRHAICREKITLAINNYPTDSVGLSSSLKRVLTKSVAVPELGS
jgi:hypothetical protein